MAYQIKMGDDGIIRLSFDGDIDVDEMQAFRKEFEVYLDAAAEGEPVSVISSSQGLAKFSSGARKIFVEMQDSPGVGKAAVLGANRYTRVLASFVLKASGRDNVRFFDTEAEAVAWLTEGTG